MGLQLFGLGVWGLMREAAPLETTLRLLVLADRFAYVRMIPTLSWERAASMAERRAPGRLAAIRGEYLGREPATLLDDAREVVQQLGR